MQAFGHPGIDPTWSSSAKDVVGCALGTARVWFTVGRGILNEIYYPRTDIPQIRDLGFIVADGAGFWVEVKRLGNHVLSTPGDGVPAVQVVHRHPRFELTLRVVPAASRDVLLVEVTLAGDAGLRPYALLAPHLGGTGHDNAAEVASVGGRKVLWAEQGPFGLALAAVDGDQRDAFGRGSAGYVGVSDGWQDFSRNGAMTWEHPRAGPGNVALLGELPRRAVLALGFGSSRESAATLALSQLLEPFEAAWSRQADDWQRWHARCGARAALPAALGPDLERQWRVSAMVLRAHQDKTYPGTMVASLSVPWGNTRDERGGYHLVWPRDLVECAGALLALGADGEARDVLRYLIATQHADGPWNQNQWLGGKAYWPGIQLDEAAFPVLLASALAERDALDGIEVADMVRRALSFIARHGPASDQDRWEEDAGLNAFTLAACIAAFVAGSRWLDDAARNLTLALADYWNAELEDWTAVSGTPLARELGISGYYVRVAPAETLAGPQAMERAIPIRNRSPDVQVPASAQLGVDFLQLVRFGLRQADDPLIRASVLAVDARLRVETPSGTAWRRYTGDGYGEHDDGSPYDGTGRGRAWPLLTGERGHYELARGADVREYLRAMAAMASEGGLLPEQVWDAEPIPDRALAPGRPTGGAMPLAWAHAEFVKLAASISLGRPYDRPTPLWERYHGRRPDAERTVWCEHAPVDELLPGTRLIVALSRAGRVRLDVERGPGTIELPTSDSGLGLHVAEFDTRDLPAGQRIALAFARDGSGDWIGHDIRIVVGSGTS